MSKEGKTIEGRVTMQSTPNDLAYFLGVLIGRLARLVGLAKTREVVNEALRGAADEGAPP